MSKANASLLLKAIRIVNQHHDLSDAIYDVRERHGGDDGFEGDSWHHPKVLEYSAAIDTLRAQGALDPLPEDPKTQERSALLAIVKTINLDGLPIAVLRELAELMPSPERSP